MAEGERVLIEVVNCGHPEHVPLNTLVKDRGMCLTCGLAALAAAHEAGRRAGLEERDAMAKLLQEMIDSGDEAAAIDWNDASLTKCPCAWCECAAAVLRARAPEARHA
jgi:hypothetical protein